MGSDSCVLHLWLLSFWTLFIIGIPDSRQRFGNRICFCPQVKGYGDILLSPSDKNNIIHRTCSSFWTLSNVSYSKKNKLFRKQDPFLSSGKMFRNDQFKLTLSNVSSFLSALFKRWWKQIQFPKHCARLERQKMKYGYSVTLRLSILN
jgi:hypothetical protein